MANACILLIIISEFSYWKEFSPIILFIIDENPKISLHQTILPFDLAIILRAKGSKELLFNL